MPETLPDTPATIVGSPGPHASHSCGDAFCCHAWLGRMVGRAQSWCKRGNGNAQRLPGSACSIRCLQRCHRNLWTRLDISTIYDKSVTGLIRELHDPYTAFLSAERLGRLGEQISGVYAGVGLQVDIRDNWPTVIEPISGGPRRAGSVAGWRSDCHDQRGVGRRHDAGRVFACTSWPSGV